MGGHRPFVGIEGDGAFGIDDDHLARVQGPLGLEQGVPGVAAAAVNRDLLGTAQQPPEHRQIEQIGPGQEVRPASVVGQELADHHRVE
ncbi:hypothetical protein SDC9_171296 [bioreactor metagenome]|uniref:Uncharacterized protein n=1 Tax=bioreactor metagenome TaxID=1076179 RepID=A0A645GJK9_9ZZZZ